MTDIQKRIDDKLAKVRQLADVISMGANAFLSKETKMNIENEQFKMEFALKNLVDEAREKEADIKIKHMEQVVTYLKDNG